MIAKTDPFGVVYSNAIKGSVVQDFDLDCSIDPDETGFYNWLVRADGNKTYYGITDEQGNYFIELDTGLYQVEVLPPAPYWEKCIPSETVHLQEFQDTSGIDFLLQDTVSCPLLEIDISTPFLRRCFDNIYYVNYTNLGTAPSENTQIEIQLDSFLQVISTSIPWEGIMDDIYTFSVEDLAPGESGSFSIKVHVDCEENGFRANPLCVRPNLSRFSLCRTRSGLGRGQSHRDWFLRRRLRALRSAKYRCW